mgnify:CR=1 FL=1|jgi:hypothetical protein
MQEVPLIAGSENSNNLYMLILDLKTRKVKNSTFIQIPDEFEYSFDYEGLFLNQSSDVYCLNKYNNEKTFAKNY